MTAPSIVSINPANGAEGVVLSDSIYVIFDQEVDTTTIQILVEGADTDRWSGPDQARWDDPDTDADDDVLATPGYKGILAGSLTFERVDENGDAVIYYDYTGNGSLWRTKAVFTPAEPLAASTTFRVWVVGDETTGDDIESGASTRTVFDTAKGANLGDGDVYFTGGYSGTVEEDIYTVQIQEAGSASDKVLFKYWRASAPLVIRELYTSQRSQLLNDGVYVRFSGDFEINDEFTVHVKTGTRMESTYTWTFTTGAGSIATVPSTTYQSTPVGGFTDTVVSTSADAFRVLSVTPANRATNLDPDTIDYITIQFSDDIDEDTISNDTVEVWTEPVNGIFDDNDIEYTGELVRAYSVDGDTLTIFIA